MILITLLTLVEQKLLWWCISIFPPWDVVNYLIPVLHSSQ
jgi:hypothetical protein